MAVYIDGYLKGAFGPYVFRKMYNKQVVSRRLAKGEMKQTEATKKMAGVFGKASMLGRQIRETVERSIDKQNDPAMSRRLTTNLRQILSTCRDPETEQYSFEEQSFSKLNGFDYNIKSPLNKSLKQNLVADLKDGVLSIDLPAVQPQDLLLFPDGSSACELTIAISLFRLGDAMKKYGAELQVIKIKKRATDIVQQHFEFNVPDGCLCVVSVFLQYYDVVRNLAKVINSKTFSPAGICFALISPDIYENTDDRKWVRMFNLKFDVKTMSKVQILVGPIQINGVTSS